MYTRAKKILASELMYALDMEEDEAETHLEELIGDAHAEPQRRGRPRLATRIRCAVVGIVPAAGSGERLGADRPKAFVVCAGRPLIEWSLDVLREVCDRVVVAVPPRATTTGPTRARAAPSRSALGAQRARRGAGGRRSWSCTTPRGRSSRRELVERCVTALEPGVDGAIAAVP